MDIPKEIKIGGTKYAVKPVHKLVGDVGLLHGLIDYIDCTISLNEDQDWQVSCETVIHEILHGIIYHYNVHIDNDKEEEVVDAMAKGLYQVLEDNWDLYEKGDCLE